MVGKILVCGLLGYYILDAIFTGTLLTITRGRGYRRIPRSEAPVFYYVALAFYVALIIITLRWWP